MNNYCAVPQPTSSSTKFYCENKEDKCFNKFKILTCFRCFDGTIILNSQVCDGIIDCQDLSDECTCENSKVKPLCNLFYAKKKSLNFKTICNLEYEFPDGVDEKHWGLGVLNALPRLVVRIKRTARSADRDVA